MFWETLKGVGKGAIIGGVAGGLIGGTGGAIAAYGATSVAGTAMITATATVTARATEVGVLQGRASSYRGESGWAIANDCVCAIFDNGRKILTPLATKAGTTSATYFAKDITMYKVVPLGFLEFLGASGGKILPYAFATYAWGNTVYSALCDDPIGRANQRGYYIK